LNNALIAFLLLTALASSVSGQRLTCPPQGWTVVQLESLKKDAFKIADTFQRHELAVALTACLGHPKPELRDGIAFEALSSWMRGGQLDLATVKTIRGDLLKALSRSDAEGFSASFSALVLGEVARTDRLQPWMTADERDDMVRAAALFLARVKDYRAFSDTEGFRHAVAHGADLVLQLALNALVAKAQLDHMMLAVASQVAPPGTMAYWAGEPDRLARPIVFIAQRKLHSDAEWQTFFGEITNPQPLPSWRAAFLSETGIKKRHNVRAFLLSVYASASSSEDPGIRALLPHATAALKAVQ
jgi:hypothetical protein